MEELKATGSELVPLKKVAITIAKKRKPRKTSEMHFAPKIRVKMDNGSMLSVPRDTDSNKNASIILAELVRNFVKGQIAKLSAYNRPMTPQEVKELVTAAKLANEMSIVAHEDIFIPSDSKITKGHGAATKGMLQAVEAAARGMASGSAQAQSDAVQKFMDLGKKNKKVEAIEVEVTDITPNNP